MPVCSPERRSTCAFEQDLRGSGVDGDVKSSGLLVECACNECRGFCGGAVPLAGVRVEVAGSWSLVLTCSKIENKDLCYRRAIRISGGIGPRC